LVEIVLLMSSKVSAEGAGLLAVDHEIDHARLGQALDIDLLEHRTRIGLRDQLIGGAHQGRITLLAAVLKPEREARGVAEIVDRRRLQRGDLCVTD
jgi:hypothetical protein